MAMTKTLILMFSVMAILAVGNALLLPKSLICVKLEKKLQLIDNIKPVALQVILRSIVNSWLAEFNCGAPAPAPVPVPTPAPTPVPAPAPGST
ncbi:hypothetical protein U1Q18_037142 [Sarracenia purpurea var. burkii]